MLSFLKNHKRLFGLAVGAMLVASLFEGVQLSLFVPLVDRAMTGNQIVLPQTLPASLEQIINYFNGLGRLETLYLIAMIVPPLFLVKHIFVYFYQFLMNDVAQKVMRDVRHKLYAKLNHLSLDYFSRKRTGELISRITHDVQIIENAVSYGVTDMIRQPLMIAIYIMIAFSIHFKAALVMFLLFPLIGWPISKIGKKLRKLSRSAQETMADISSLLFETISGVRVVKAFNTEDYETQRFGGKNHMFYKWKMKSVRRTLFINPITEIFGVICGVGIVVWLGTQVINGQLSFGIFTAFMYSIFSIVSPAKKLGNVNAITQQALAANHRIYDILDEKPSVRELMKPVDFPHIQKGITLEGVSFRYDPEGPDVLKDIDLEIKAGELVAIVGPTGAGKSTLVNLIPRFYDATEGSVKIDDRDVKTASFRSLRLQIGTVAQEAFLFNDTVKFNIAYGRDDVSQADIESAAHKAYADRFIKDMPQGYDTVIGDRGFRLSGGEKQRITIARAILKNPPIMILDEATSQLDSESEKYIQEALDHLMQGRTVIAIAHRLSTIQKADKIVVLEAGRIVGMAPHAELLETCPLYQRLYETQFQSDVNSFPNKQLQKK